MGVKSEGEDGRGMVGVRGGCGEMTGVVPQVSQSGGDHGGTPTRAAPRSRLGSTLANTRVTNGGCSSSTSAGGSRGGTLSNRFFFLSFFLFSYLFMVVRCGDGGLEGCVERSSQAERVGIGNRVNGERD